MTSSAPEVLSAYLCMPQQQQQHVAQITTIERDCIVAQTTRNLISATDVYLRATHARLYIDLQNLQLRSRICRLARKSGMTILEKR